MTSYLTPLKPALQSAVEGPPNTALSYTTCLLLWRISLKFAMVVWQARADISAHEVQIYPLQPKPTRQSTQSSCGRTDQLLGTASQTVQTYVGQDTVRRPWRDFWQHELIRTSTGSLGGAHAFNGASQLTPPTGQLLTAPIHRGQ